MITKEKVIKIKLDKVNWDFTVYGNKTKFYEKWANEFSVNKKTIENILLNKSWKDITV